MTMRSPSASLTSSRFHACAGGVASSSGWSVDVASSRCWAILHDRYEKWIGNFRHCSVLGIDVRDYDLVGDPAAVDTIVDQGRAPRSLRREGYGAITGRRSPRFTVNVAR